MLDGILALLPVAWIRYGSMPRGASVQLTVGPLKCSGEIADKIQFNATFNFTQVDDFLSFNKVELNNGNGFNEDTNAFEAPKNGYYLFRVMSVQCDSSINIYRNERQMGRAIYGNAKSTTDDASVSQRKPYSVNRLATS